MNIIFIYIIRNYLHKLKVVDGKIIFPLDIMYIVPFKDTLNPRDTLVTFYYLKSLEVEQGLFSSSSSKNAVTRYFYGRLHV